MVRATECKLPNVVGARVIEASESRPLFRQSIRHLQHRSGPKELGCEYADTVNGTRRSAIRVLFHDSVRIGNEVCVSGDSELNGNPNQPSQRRVRPMVFAAESKVGSPASNVSGARSPLNLEYKSSTRIRGVAATRSVQDELNATVGKRLLMPPKTNRLPTLFVAKNKLDHPNFFFHSS